MQAYSFGIHRYITYILYILSPEHTHHTYSSFFWRDALRCVDIFGHDDDRAASAAR